MFIGKLASPIGKAGTKAVTPRKLRRGEQRLLWLAETNLRILTVVTGKLGSCSVVNLAFTPRRDQIGSYLELSRFSD